MEGAILAGPGPLPSVIVSARLRGAVSSSRGYGLLECVNVSARGRRGVSS